MKSCYHSIFESAAGALWHLRRPEKPLNKTAIFEALWPTHHCSRAFNYLKVLRWLQRSACNANRMPPRTIGALTTVGFAYNERVHIQHFGISASNTDGLDEEEGRNLRVVYIYRNSIQDCINMAPVSSSVVDLLALHSALHRPTRNPSHTHSL